MSIINQVLNELEKRGANAPLDEAAIRAIPPRKPLHLVRYALLALLLLILLAAAKWFAGRQEIRTPVIPVAIISPVSGVALSGPASAVAIASAPVEVIAAASGSNGVGGSPPFSGLHGKPLLEVKSDEEPVVASELKKKFRRKPNLSADQSAENVEITSAESIPGQHFKKISPQQRAENEFRKANLAVQEGRANDALAGYEAALLIDSSFKAARQAWVSVLLNLKRNDEAEQVLQKGLKQDPHDASFAILLARLQVERNAVPQALETLQTTLPYAEGNADYHAFLAALLQRQSRHEEAVVQYQFALKLIPNNGIWLMGMGISLQALQRNEEARASYQRALASNGLSAQLQAFVQQKLKAL
jgi:MSHA biogenesis protein MshN